MATLKQTGPAEYELDYGTMRFSLRVADGQLKASGGGSSSNVIDDIDWEEYREQAEIEANEILAELVVLDPPDVVELPHALAICDREMTNWICRHPQDLSRVDSRSFERIVAEILKTFGFDVQLTPKTRDGGYDIIAVGKDLMGISTRYLLECKHPTVAGRVGVVPVRALYGVKQQIGVEHAVLVTDYWFTRDAWAFASDPHVWNLHLKDRDALLEWLHEYKRMKGSFSGP